jgi:hypothetical protein
MEKLVLRYYWCIPYEASGEVNHPFEYESKEQAFVDFTELLEKSDYDFEFLGENFDTRDAKSAEFFTLEEWFERFKIKN